MAMFCVMIYMEELHDLHVKKKENKDNVRKLFLNPYLKIILWNTLIKIYDGFVL